MINCNTIKISPEQQTLISNYRNKWQQIAISTEPINRDRATEAINKSYAFIDKPQPNILFLSNPYTALEYIYDLVKTSWGKLENTSLGNPIAFPLTNQLLGNMRSELPEEISEKLMGNIDNDSSALVASKTVVHLQEVKLFLLIQAHMGQGAIYQVQNFELDEIYKILLKSVLEFQCQYQFITSSLFTPFMWYLFNQLTDLIAGENVQIKHEFLNNFFVMFFTGKFPSKTNAKYQLPIVEVSSAFSNAFISSVMADYGYYINYCHEVLNCDRDEIKWNIFYDLITNCGWIFPYEKTVIVCQRTTSIDFDINNDLS